MKNVFSSLILLLSFIFIGGICCFVYSVFVHSFMMFFTSGALCMGIGFLLLVYYFFKIVPEGSIKLEFLPIDRCTYLPVRSRICFNCAFFFDHEDADVPFCTCNWCYGGNEGFEFLNKKLICSRWLFVGDY